MNRSSKRILEYILLGVLLLISSACTSPITGNSSQTPIVVTMIVTATPVPTSTPVVRDTSTLPTPTQTMTPAPTPTPLPPAEAIITYPWLNMREGPGSWYALVAKLDQGARLVLLAQYDQCAWLQVRTDDGMTGWVIANDEYLDMNVPCDALPSGAFRPATSVMRRNLSSDGDGELEISNETEADSLVVLTWKSAPVYAGYVRSGETIYISSLVDGNYELFFCHGTGWNGRAFMHDVSYYRYDNVLDFHSDDETYTVWTVTLLGLNGGGTPDTVEVEGDAFPAW